MSRGTFIKYDKEKVSFNLAKLKKAGEEFEVVINPDDALDYKSGKDPEIRDALRSEHVYKSAIKGELASEHELMKVFGTDNALEVAKIIIKEGIIQLTDEHREKMREEKRKKILDILHANAIDPKTKLPHPITRLENAFEEAKVRVDEHKSAEDQVHDILKKLQPILPIKIAMAQVQIHLPANVASKLHSTIKKYGTLLKDNWLSDGSWQGTVEMPAGLKLDLMDELNKATHGGADIKITE